MLMSICSENLSIFNCALVNYLKFANRISKVRNHIVRNGSFFKSCIFLLLSSDFPEKEPWKKLSKV